MFIGLAHHLVAMIEIGNWLGPFSLRVAAGDGRIAGRGERELSFAVRYWNAPGLLHTTFGIGYPYPKLFHAGRKSREGRSTGGAVVDDVDGIDAADDVAGGGACEVGLFVAFDGE